MNFVAFRYFNEVAKTKAIRRAADRLHVAPSAVSRQLAMLEHSFGAPLLERTNTGVELTPAGVLLERYTRNMFRELDQVKDSISGFRSLRQGEVKIHVMEGVLSSMLPEVIAGFSSRFPGIRFSVSSNASDAIVEALIKNQTDIGITYNASLRPELEIVVERADPVMCLVATNHPLAQNATVRLDEICQNRLALPHRGFGLRQLFDSAVEARRLQPDYVVETNNIELPRAMAATGNCVTLGPVLAAFREIQMGLLVAIPIDVPTFLMVRSSVCVHRDRKLSFAAHEFIKMLRMGFSQSGIAA
ncbi:LysR family transcriptional regulator [Paenirhodobacter populi]|uniref:LysR family transcriptional regulator n=1 Tax=Paenirhodobacter populi TaxID=2306993 RepID=A0A443JIZ0_9RHOB|nr:LysR family transcriptional regulator [Sinirhodobacter populi]RWR09535.1 LysR family transcriptional regulator [Sinirhodobacter populi]RWR10293.1 LysR family transcriptional regulator [Sinirhodobacter populi]RWR20480.1 LysR family transcriptional regulator [Sinirhodobacter populi]RWR26179.1 LysR family transcriptional regulator [Sinirhodobacter populi]